jgi:hypothetical protein
MNKSLAGMFVFLLIGLGVGLLAGGWKQVREGREADEVGPPPRTGQFVPLTGSAPHMAKMYLDRTRKTIEALKIPDAEQKAIDAAVEGKFAAREQLQKQSLWLYQVAVDLESSDEALDRAIKDYLEAKDRFQRRIRKIDDDLVKRVSLRTRAKIITTGALDNGLGFLSSKLPVPPGLPASGGPGSNSPHRGAPGSGLGTGTRASPGGVGAAAGAARPAP